MKQLTRFIQPRSPYFWLMMLFNALTGLLAWVSQTMPLPWALRLLIAVLAIGNGVLGFWALRLMLRATATHSEAEQPK
jgi:hypothetical protein